MLTVEKLKIMIKDIPDDAVVYVEADHGQLPEGAGGVFYTTDSELPYYGDEISWIDDEEETVEFDKVTAINIGY